MLNLKVKYKFLFIERCPWGRRGQYLSSLILAELVVFFFSQVLQAIPSVIIVAFHLPPKIATMTPARAIVPLHIQVLGGTTTAIIQT